MFPKKPTMMFAIGMVLMIDKRTPIPFGWKSIKEGPNLRIIEKVNPHHEICKMFGRLPDFIVGDCDDPYLLRWYVIPKNRLFNIYLHKFVRSDDDRALHDHPWASVGMILKGEYFEEVPVNIEAYKDNTDRSTIKILRTRFKPVVRGTSSIHRVELIPIMVGGFSMTGRDENHERIIVKKPLRKEGEKTVWTIFLTGPRVRDWGFWCPNGWRIWTDFINKTEGGNTVGKGCE